jgi:hypothetical protein
MPTIAAVMTYPEERAAIELTEALAASDAVTRLFLFQGNETEVTELSSLARNRSSLLRGNLFSGSGINRVLDNGPADYLLFVLPGDQIQLGQRAIERFVSTGEDSDAGLIYSDFRDDDGNQAADHPLLDYQLGSIRDGFDFGPVFLVSKRATELAVQKHGGVDKDLQWAGLYDLRLKLSIDSTMLRIPEPLYTRVPSDRRTTGERQFDYVDPRQRTYQIEMEHVATEHLKRIGAYLTPRFRTPETKDVEFSVRASIVIPVRNRERTIREAANSALSQRAPFEFNVIVVDNHSTDRTTEILAEMASHDHRLIHLKPTRTDLGIGGCWNEAIYSTHCGKYAAQLDSDDLYSSEHALEAIVSKLEEGPYAMVIGSYKIVNFDLDEIPPGLIDHREWTPENGLNNALRINGLGAPRAFYVPILRRIGFPNASYGEDYAVALRISRYFEIGRIFDPIYYARRWEGNSDAALPLATANRYDAYKDRLRTVEILARQRLNRQ